MNKGMRRGVVFDIQRYSIHDGPGIRTTVFFKGCPLRCDWCQNPESQSAKPEIFFDRSRCSRCGECVAICPEKASSLSGESLRLDRRICRGCGKCADLCPHEARKLVGRYMTVDEVMHPILKDIKFYENSGGGVTLSGGEPTAQIHFALALLRRCQELGLHTALETCGYASWTQLEKLLAYTDLFLYDIKHLQEAKHLEGTGKNNFRIIDNAIRIAKVRPMIVRVPLIPHFNDSPEEIRAIARFGHKELGSIGVDLLPYNRLGEGKYERLDRRCISRKSREEDYLRILEDIVHQETGPGMKLPPVEEIQPA
ncbi:MAG: glycyl-radical enzyme activating protein [Deltaproteobacteria bacterium]|nr:glycyl-radical enzyme activating protein [Deltaproteobacteria bacterium]